MNILKIIRHINFYVLAIYMRKIPRELENPIDNIFIDAADHSLEYYKKLNFTPNGITTLSLLSAVLSIILFYNNYFTLATIFFLLSYYFDCADGAYARRYDMVTDFGDLYDHFTDVFKIISIYVVIYLKSKEKFNDMIIPSSLLILFLNIHLGCQQKFYNSPKTGVLDNLQCLCTGDSKTIMPITRYFSSATFILYIAYTIYTFK
jgi:phosphatidylglycerophosphate synthase